MVAVSLEQSAAGNWRVCRCRITWFNDLRLGAANKLAREMARDEHQRLGCQVRVKMPGSISMIVLARYADDGDESGRRAGRLSIFGLGSTSRHDAAPAYLRAADEPDLVPYDGSTELLAMRRRAA